jgi:phenylalanyl-tRNA synthetase alpha chain
MLDKFNQLVEKAKSFKVSSSEDLENFRLTFLVKKGLLSELIQEFKTLPNDQKKELGKVLNITKQTLEEIYNTNSKKIISDHNSSRFNNDLPGYYIESGSRHIISSVVDEMTAIFERLGFSVSVGPEIEDDWHNFSALNFPKNHPARDMQDTFFVDQEIALRTHTSSVQVRLMELGNLPIRSIMPGRVYRNEAISSRSNCFFHQVEGLYIDKGVSFSDLKQTLYNFVKEFFGPGY